MQRRVFAALRRNRLHLEGCPGMRRKVAALLDACFEGERAKAGPTLS